MKMISNSNTTVSPSLVAKDQRLKLNMVNITSIYNKKDHLMYRGGYFLHIERFFLYEKKETKNKSILGVKGSTQWF